MVTVVNGELTLNYCSASKTSSFGTKTKRNGSRRSSVVMETSRASSIPAVKDTNLLWSRNDGATLYKLGTSG